VILSSTPLAERLDGDLLVFGGPKAMPLTRRLLDEIGPRLGVDQGTAESPTVIVCTKGADVYSYDGMVQDGKIVTDYGLLLRARNPYNPRSRVFIISGSHTYGNIAAARFIADTIRHPIRNRGHVRLLFSDEFAVVVSSRISDEYVSPPKVEFSSSRPSFSGKER
jgi:hypothetical protein